MIEGYVVLYKNWYWVVRGIETYRGGYAAFPRYPADNVDILSVKEPAEALSIARNLSPETIVFFPCMGREVPLLKQGQGIVIDPLSPLRVVRDTTIYRRAIELIGKIKRDTGLETVGLTGGLLVGRKTSDIDLVVYGDRETRLIYDYLSGGGPLQSYSLQEALKVIFSRGESVISRLLLKRETEKKLQGKYRGIDVYVRLVPSYPWEKRECRYNVEKRGEVRLQAMVKDDIRGAYYPCSYDALVIQGGNVPRETNITVRSDRGRYCERLRKGDAVLLYGELEVKRSGEAEELQVTLWKKKHYAIPIGIG